MKTTSKYPPAKYWDHPLNFQTGCTKESIACNNCWAESTHEARRKALIGGANLPEMYRRSFTQIQFFPEMFKKKLALKPKTYFVDNTSDICHPKVPESYRFKTFQYLWHNDRHRFLILTKRSTQLRESIDYFLSRGDMGRPIPPHESFWLGVTGENQRLADDRCADLVMTPAKHRWMSVEPMRGQMDISHWLTGDNSLDWVVIGAESGANRRKSNLDWYYWLADQCEQSNTPYFIKQLPLNGICEHRIEKFPKDLRNRDLPWETAA